jgi:RimJ/RimL family protein N-acetyltransferase
MQGIGKCAGLNDMQLSFQPLFIETERELLADWLSTDRWPYHGNPQPSRDSVLQQIDQGDFTGADSQSFWMMTDSNQRVGLIRLFDLDDVADGAPMFDLRVHAEYRRRGIGKTALRWLTCHLFETFPELQRIEGCTRIDNLAMRHIFLQCNYVKEGHYRKAWSTIEGDRLDAMTYGILREDWINQTITPVNWDETL